MISSERSAPGLGRGHGEVEAAAGVDQGLHREVPSAASTRTPDPVSALDAAEGESAEALRRRPPASRGAAPGRA